MIDFIRVHYKNKTELEDFILNPKNFNETFTVMEYHSGDILHPYKAHLKNMDIIVNEKNGYVKNSIHKLHNVLETNENHNHNDFTYSQLHKIIEYLKSKIIHISSNKLTQLEFGLNIQTSRPAEEIISKYFLMHKLSKHTLIKNINCDGYLMAFEHYNFIIKVYDKAKQYNIKDRNILRFEIKFTDKSEFNPLGVYTISDLTNKEVLNNLFEKLLQRFDELLIVDDFFEEEIPSSDFHKLNMFSSPSYWERLKKYSREYKSKQKKQYLSLLEKYKLLETKKNLKEQLVNKFNYLISN